MDAVDSGFRPQRPRSWPSPDRRHSCVQFGNEIHAQPFALRLVSSGGRIHLSAYGPVKNDSQDRRAREARARSRTEAQCSESTSPSAARRSISSTHDSSASPSAGSRSRLAISLCAMRARSSGGSWSTVESRSSPEAIGSRLAFVRLLVTCSVISRNPRAQKKALSSEQREHLPFSVARLVWDLQRAPDPRRDRARPPTCS